MNRDLAISVEDRPDEIVELVRSLHATEHRLQQLAGGELDSVLCPDGQSYLLHEAQAKLQRSEAAQRELAATQSSILNALPAHIALLDHEGVIVSVNDGWRRFAGNRALADSSSGVGLNYLQNCERAQGAGAEEAHAVAVGMRSVLSGAAREFSLDYPCHSPSEQRWFRLKVNPIWKDGQLGAVVMHLNITASREAEERLAANEVLLRLFIDHTPAAIAMLDTQMRYIQASERWMEDYQLAGQKIIGRSHYEVFPDAPERWKEIHQRVLAGAIERCEEDPFPRADGTVDWLRWEARPWRQAGGEIGGLIFFTQVITARKKAEVELRFNERRYRSLVQATSAIVWDTTASGEFEVEQPSWSAFTGQSFAEYRGWGWLEAVHPDDRAETTRLWLAAVASRTIYAVELRLRAADRSYRNMQVRGVPILADDGTIRQWTGIHTDITERKRAEERIAEQASLIDQSQDAIFLRDLEHYVTFWNKGAERLYGWTAEEAIGRFVGEFLHPDPVTFREAVEALKKEGTWAGEMEKGTKAGARLMVASRWTVVRDTHGRPKSILVIDTDITERKKIEQQFLRSQRMESIGTLAGGIAHDLNNSLSPIIMALDLLAAKFADHDSVELLEIVRSSARRGADMVRQVLSFARGVEGERRELQIRHLVRDIEKIVKDTFVKSIRVRTAVPNDLWTVMGDATQIHQVLLNLCVNARDAMPEGGKLTIAAENLTLDALSAGLDGDVPPGDYVFLQVEDSGIGMPPEIIEKIFDPFFTTKEIGKGTGLGLSTSLAIVKSHGGFVRVYSEPGNGTKVKVYLPGQTETAAAGLAERSVDLPRGQGELILIVDDEPSVRMVAEQTLQAFGYRVMLAADGAEAVAAYAARGAEIDAVVTDMMMPIMDGPATIQVLRKLSATLPIIAASGLSENDYGTKFSSLGVKHFLPKPYTAETLLKVLRETLRVEPLRPVAS